MSFPSGLRTGDIRVNIADGAPELYSADAPSQDLTLLEIEEHSHEDELAQAVNKFSTANVQNVSLNYIHRLFKTKDRARALKLLRKRIKVEWRSATDYVSKPKDWGNNLDWAIKKHFIDALVIVSRGPGLGALLPNVASDMSWQFTIDTDKKQMGRNFSVRHAKLGFNPSGRMLRIGATNMSEDVWIALAPKTFSTDDAEMLEDPKHGSPEQTILQPKHRRIFLLFFAYILSKVPAEDIYISEKYPCLDAKDEAFNAVSNFLSQSHAPIRLSVFKSKRLDALIKEHYEPWIQHAPASYKDDGFFESSIPISITSRCGQNQETCYATNTGCYEEELGSWNRLRDFRGIRFVTVAIASHVSPSIAEDIEPRPPANIADEHGEDIWTSVDPEIRQQVSINDLANLEDETRLFNKEGFEIHRFQHRFSDEGPYKCGALVDFEHIGSLFDQDENLRYSRAGPPDNSSRYYGYPQAGLVTAGHVQAQCLITPFYPLLERVNVDILKKSLSIEDDDELMEPSTWPVSGVSSQMYNAVMHHTRGKGSQHHEVARGYVSAALGGLQAFDTAHSKAAQDLLVQCQGNMPHRLYELKAGNEDICKDLRLENVYQIDFDQISAPYRNGRFLYKEIIRPLAFSWLHASLVDIMKENTVLFSETAFPAIYIWMTFALTVLIEVIWNAGHDLARQPTVRNVELCAVAERALNFLHTGNTSVLVTRLMGPLWTSLSLISDGWACFNPNLVILRGDDTVKLDIKHWPFDATTHLPISAAVAGQGFHFNNKQGYMAVAALELASSKSISHLKLPPGQGEYQDILASISVDLWLNDIKSLMEKTFGSEIELDCNSKDPKIVERGKKRKWAHREWSNLKYPLASDRESVTRPSRSRRQHTEKLDAWQLLCIVADANTTNPVKLSDERWTTDELGTKLVEMTRKVRPTRIEAPLLRGGLMHHGLVLAQHKLSRNQADPAIRFSKALARAVGSRRIEFVPYHKPSQGRSHPFSARPQWWLRISDPTRPQSTQQLTLQCAEALDEARRNPTSPWDIPSNLADIVHFLHKTVLPRQWNISHASLGKRDEHSALMHETYEWVDRNFNGDTWEHRMALLWAILFTRILPNVTYSTDEISKNYSGPATTQAILNLQWEVATQKGCKDRAPYIVMLTTFIISWLDSASPLRQHVEAGRPLGPRWSEKHRTKGLHIVNLIRMNIAIALGSGVGRSPQFRDNWDVKDKPTLKSTYERVQAALQKKPFGIYNAYLIIFGRKAADLVANREGFQAPRV